MGASTALTHPSIPLALSPGGPSQPGQTARFGMKPITALGLVTHLLVLSPESAGAAGLGPHQRAISSHRFAGSHHHRPGRGNGHWFPALTQLRDSVVELLFGRHPAKAANPAGPHRNPPAQYAGERVLRFNVSTLDEEAALAEAAGRLFLDVWAFSGDYVDIRLHADQVAPLFGLLPPSLRSSQSTLIPDLAAAVYQSRPAEGGRTEPTDPETEPWSVGTQLGASDNLFFQDYQPLNVIVRWMRLVEAMFPSYVDYISVGKSYEGRDMPALRVGMPALANSFRPRKTLVVSGGLHAREWISTTSVNYLAWSFVTSFGKEPMVTKLLEEVDIVFMPALNPDGIEYSWQVDRLWRKSRQGTSMRFCRGINLDHAFGFAWDGSGPQHDPCSESYGGEEPFQAVEAKQLATWATNEAINNNVQFVGLVDLHSYSQQILFPYSYTCAVDPPNLENLQELAAGIAKAIRISNGETYSTTSACEGAVVAEKSRRDAILPRIESGGGSAVDWFYHELGARYSYQIKLRDTGSHGFLLPREHIVPTGEEMFSAMKYLGDYILGNNGIEGSLAFEEEDAVDRLGFGRSDEDQSVMHELRMRRRSRR